LLASFAVLGCAGASPDDHKPDLATGIPPAPVDAAQPAPPDFATVVAVYDLTVVDDLTPQPDLIPRRLPGDPCTSDGDCASMMCRDVGSGNHVCVAACTSESDCAGFTDSFCEATAAGSSTGYCIPKSPSHCASCASDGDCGTLAERCVQVPGDIAAACHVDCALGGSAACPSDYDCKAISDNGQMRQLCVPKVGVCLDSVGGFCGRDSLPQSCTRTNPSGTCIGERACLQGAGRYDKCDAMAPQAKSDCSQQDPAGCMLVYSQAAISTAQNCGACGNTCPGANQSTGDASCVNPTNKQCGFTCRGDHYDIDNNANDGCEAADDSPDNHTQNDAFAFNSTDCYDSDSQNTFHGHILSDQRAHTNPTVNGFDGSVGAAPDWFSVFDSGGSLCQDDYSVTFTTTGGGGATCYKCSILTNKTSNSVTISGNSSQSMSGGVGSYGDNSTIFFKIEKTCSQQTNENVAYTVSYHL
jgi:hypothetical protein